MALALLGTSGFFIYYSREARSYSIYLALASISSLAYWRFWQKATWGRAVSYSIWSIALIYTHYTALAILAAHALYFIFGILKIPPEKRLSALMKAAMAFASIGLAFALWWLLFGAEQFRINTSIEAAGALPSDWATVAAIWLLLTSGVWGYFALIFVFSRLNAWLWYWKKFQIDASPYLFILLIGLVPPMILLGANAAGLAIFQMRYLIAIVPAWALLVALALSQLWIPFVKNQILLGGISLLILLGLVFQQIASYREFWPEKPRWAEATQLASENRHPLEPALVYLDERSPFAYYAYQDGLLDGLSIRISWREFSPLEIADLAENITASERVWGFLAMQAPESWDAVAALSANRGIRYRDSVQWTIYYGFDAASSEQLAFNFGQSLDYQNPFYQRFASRAGESICIPIKLEALEAIPETYSIGIHLTRGYNEVLSQVDEALGALAVGQLFERELCLPTPETGSFHLRLVIYDWREPLRRLPVYEKDLLWGDYLMLGIIQVD